MKINRREMTEYKTYERYDNFNIVEIFTKNNKNEFICLQSYSVIIADIEHPGNFIIQKLRPVKKVIRKKGLFRKEKINTYWKDDNGKIFNYFDDNSPYRIIQIKKYEDGDEKKYEPLRKYISECYYRAEKGGSCKCEKNIK